ncbi:helix-turn-helix domain-containing protein [Desulfosarcina ovata]|uniref:DNA-binding protein n=2 Tax=Desulfosarcina ovata TaxID=83564 RepID=A0A5K8ACW7_9BACT|nr:XRE family transcriptional regulator [Desulfosarcina ovata]BBO83838.1 DNA-binding protein [Desulfosarcina ovata subsp. sediminis]BBO90328.1 DNA-binding protein [Desulfosarcina ovata subsp. ovata]
MPAKKTGRLTPVGKRIKKARTDKKMTYATLANETGFSIDFIKQVESGKVTPPVGSLLQLSRALEIDSGDLLKDEEGRMQDRIKAYTKRTSNYAYTTLTPGAENKHLKAFRVKIDAKQDHPGVSYNHTGEEFVYVLEGTIEVMVGEHINALGPGDSLHFNSGIQHLLRNTGETDAELIVVIYNP